MNVGEKLQEIMDWKGLSQQDVAALSGISRTMVSQYVRGISEPTLEALRKIAAALDITVWMLLNNEPMAVKNIDLTESERQLISRYRMLSGKARGCIEVTIKTFSEVERGDSLHYK